MLYCGQEAGKAIGKLPDEAEGPTQEQQERLGQQVLRLMQGKCEKDGATAC